MGNSQHLSEEKEVSLEAKQMFRRISNDFEEEKEEHVFLNQEFLAEFSNKKPLKDIKSLNPFCPLIMKVSENWMACCLVSPIMVLVSPIYLIDKNGEFTSKCEVSIQIGENFELITVVDAILIKENQVCLAVLQKPVCKLGWMNISFIESYEELMEASLKIVNFPQRMLKSSRLEHIQKIREISTGKSMRSTEGFLLKRNDPSGSIICMTKKATPFVVGIQINEEQALLFDKEMCGKIKRSMKDYMVNNEKEIMKKMVAEGLHLENSNFGESVIFFDSIKV